MKIANLIFLLLLFRYNYYQSRLHVLIAILINYTADATSPSACTGSVALNALQAPSSVLTRAPGDVIVISASLFV